MIDLVKLVLLAGKGGDGRVAFRREKYVPKGGPSGGNGGDGGHIILRANPNLTTLQHLTGSPQLQAPSGELGGKSNKTGSRGEDIVVEVPYGTTVWLTAENQVSQARRRRYGLTWLLNRGEVEFTKYYLGKESEMIPPPPQADVLEPEAMSGGPKLKDVASLRQLGAETIFEITPENPEIVIAQGGFGGRGNVTFKSSSNTTPLEAEYGTVGEQKVIWLELRLLADIGLVGFPNAGKSTLLSRLTQANPKVANYPFTTLEPQLGVMTVGRSQGKSDQKDLVVADIPGLIEGAHAGKGLGFTFLRHLEHCRVLLFVLALDEAAVFNPDLTDTEKADQLWQQYQTLQHELKAYDEQLAGKQQGVAINKIDLYSEELLQALKDTFKAGPTPRPDFVNFISAYTGQGLDELKKKLAQF